MIEAKQYDFDAVVVGSGVSGGWAAKELTEKGLKPRAKGDNWLSRVYRQTVQGKWL